MNWNNAITELLKLRYPIVQAPMLGVTSPEMVAAISNNGALGSLPVGALSAELTATLIRKTKTLTSSPFAVNLFVHKEPPAETSVMQTMQDFLEGLCAENDVPYQRQNLEEKRVPFSYTPQVEVIIAEKIPVVSFTFGILDRASISALKEKGITLIGTATSVAEAKLMADEGIDIITAQGSEAGGHRGSFLEIENPPLTGLFSLLPRIADSLSKPVIAAGGINSGKTIKSAFLLGAQGVQLGTAFIASHESLAIPSYKLAIQRSTDSESILTRAFSGRWARGLKNKFIESVHRSGLEIPAFPHQGVLTGAIRKSARELDNREFTALWAGQSASGAEPKAAAEILQRLVGETEALS